MSYQVLARKWRPRSFETLVGQEHVVRALSHALQEGRLHHAYLFTGTRGIGKTTIARILAKSLNCETGVTAKPCGQCSACIEIDSGRFIDLLEVDAATNTRVDEMRLLLENAVYAPTRGRYKVYVIDEVHMLSNAAFNAMLKTLEEPPDHVKFILATTDPQRIPVTVLSRCLQFNLKQMPQSAIAGHLAHVLEAEGIFAEPLALRLIARAAGGSMRDALSLLDQAIAHGAGQIVEVDVRAMLGTVGDDYIFEIVGALIAKDAGRLLDVTRIMGARSLSFESALSVFCDLMIRVQVLQLAPSVQLDDDADQQRVADFASQLHPEFVQLAYGIALQGREQLPFAPDHAAGFLMTLLRLHAFAPAESNTHSAEKKSPLEIEAVAEEPRGRSSQSATPTSLPESNARVRVGAGLSQSGDIGGQPKRGSVASVDWSILVGEMQLSGMVRALAQHCELVRWSAEQVELRLSPSHRHLLTRLAQDRLQQAIAKCADTTCRLMVTLSDPVSETPAAQTVRVRREEYESAVVAIESDSTIRELIELLDATVSEPTIGRLQPAVCSHIT